MTIVMVLDLNMGLVVSLVLGVAGLTIAWWGRARVHTTTLEGPCWWVLASVFLISAVEVTAAAGNWEGTQFARFAAGCMTFCPVISLLGARRPHDRGWHLVVLSLWIILTLPSLEALVLRPKQQPDVEGLRSAFMLVLIAVGLLNGLPTRFWLSSLLLCVAQLQLLAGQLPIPAPLPETLFASSGAIGSSTLGLALYVAALSTAAMTSVKTRSPTRPLDQLWLDFRDSYGLLWGLRVAEQVNAAATMNGWDLLLRWRGFYRADGSELSEPLPKETDLALRQNLQNLLRRFVSTDWIANRLGDTNN
jgi:hypothetical protein